MRSRILVTALVLLLTHAGASTAQQTTTKVISVPGRPDAGSLGFAYGGTGIEFTADGQARFADHPVVSKVLANSEAAKLGIRSGDVILMVNGKDARDPRLFFNRRLGTKYVLRLRRGTEEREVTVTEYVPTEAERSNVLPDDPQSSSSESN